MTPSSSSSPPPTEKELTALHSLLCTNDTFKTNTNNNPQPLTGRNVMIPLTTKAFFEGTLQPSTTSTTATADGTINTNTISHGTPPRMEEERVLANLGQGYMAEMTRQQASELVRRKIDAIRSSNIDAANDTIATKKKLTNKKDKKKKKNGGKLTMKKGFLNKTVQSTSTSSKTTLQSTKVDERRKPKGDDCQAMKSHHHHQTQQQPQEESLPFFEIREELDRYGNEIKSERIHVTEQLKQLQHQIASHRNQQQQHQQQQQTQKEEEQIGNLLFDKLKIGEEMMTRDSTQDPSNSHQREELDSDDDNDNDDDDDKVMTMTETAVPDDKKYDAISKRLNELATLEEESEKKKAINSLSSKKIQGRGWNKGFLNSHKSQKVLTTKEETASDDVSATSNAGETTKTTTRNTRRSNGGMDGTISKTKTVAFSNTNEVREIPRIGNVSIQSVLPQGNNVAKPKPTTFEQDAFTGIVQERKTNPPPPNRSAEVPINTIPSSKQIPSTVNIGNIRENGLGGLAVQDKDILRNTIPIESSAHSFVRTQDTSKVAEIPKKRMSRFAMQRRQQQM